MSLKYEPASEPQEIFKANGYDETQITLIHGRLEEITLPVDKVDVIVMPPPHIRQSRPKIIQSRPNCGHGFQVKVLKTV